MFDWLISYKEWFFAGIACVLAAILLRAYKAEILSGSEPRMRPLIRGTGDGADGTPSSAAGNSLLSLTAREIEDEIVGLSHYQQNEVLKRYVGVRIDWIMRLILISVKENERGQDVRIALLQENRSSAIYVLKLSDYPELNVMREGMVIRVRANIKSIRAGHWFESRPCFSFELENAALDY